MNDFYIENEHEIVNYILGYLIFISTFFITIKIIDTSTITSLILYALLNIIASIYIVNYSKYSIFKFDLPVFNIIFYYFSIQYLIKLTNKLWSGQELIFGAIIVYFILLISIFNLYKLIKNTNSHSLLILTYYFLSSSIIILMFSCIYINTTNISINKFIQSNINTNFEGFQNNIVNFEVNYLSYNNKNKINYYNFSSETKIDKNIIQTYISSNMNPVNKLEDYILFSSLSFYNGSNNGMIVNGKFLKYNLIFQKMIFIIASFLTLIYITNNKNNNLK